MVISLVEADGLPPIAMEHMECQGMVGWGTLPQCHKHWKRECRRLMSKILKQGNLLPPASQRGLPGLVWKVPRLRGGEQNRT